MTPEQRVKLPRYAHEAIKDLEIKVHALEKALEAYSMKVPSKVEWGWNFQDQAWGYLDDRETITFRMLEKPERSIRVRLKDTNMLSVNADDQIEVLPSASNDIIIRVK